MIKKLLGIWICLLVISLTAKGQVTAPTPGSNDIVFNGLIVNKPPLGFKPGKELTKLIPPEIQKQPAIKAIFRSSQEEFGYVFVFPGNAFNVLLERAVEVFGYNFYFNQDRGRLHMWKVKNTVIVLFTYKELTFISFTTSLN